MFLQNVINRKKIIFQNFEKKKKKKWKNKPNKKTSLSEIIIHIQLKHSLGLKYFLEL